MDNEIDLREIFQVLWRGKYLIIGITALLTLAAAVYVFYMTAPTYQYSAFLDLTSYGIEGKKAMILVEQNKVIAEAAKDLTDNPNEPARSAKINLLNDKEALLQIEAKHADPEVCISSVKQIGLAAIETISEYRLKQALLEKERNEKLLIRLDEIIEEYLLSKGNQITNLFEEDPIYWQLLTKKAECLINLENLNLNLKELAEYSIADADTWINNQQKIARPVPTNKKLYIAAAMLFGLMLSILILFVRYHFLTGAPAVRGQVEKESQ